MFALMIPISADRLHALKVELTNKLPNVKSSHRCEAIARGLGYRTYAALLASVKTKVHETVHVRGDLFTAYLVDHGLDVPPKVLYQAAAKIALRDIMERTPQITVWGIGIGRPQRKDDGRWEGFRDFNKRFQSERQALTGDDTVEPFLASLAFLRRVTPTKTIRPGTGSYWLKHIAENYVCNYPEGEELGPIYVPNGALIAAALHMGFKIKTYVDEKGYEEVNASFNMSKPCLIDLDCEIRPNGAQAQDRRHREQMKRNRHLPYGSTIF